ncbi:MAG: sulfurtransferase [Oscillatoriales cyanobacterium]|nr:MAG: sulfurtransferase [Oscillatoriales cyanobacterium]
MTRSPLITPQDLAQVLAHPDRSCVVLDCRFSLQDPDRGESEYRESHIVGAVYLSLERDLAAPITPDGKGGRHPLPPITALEATFSRLGIECGVTDVFVYDDSRFAFAARLWWMLRYCGHDRVFILDGGFGGWVAAGLPVTSETLEAMPAEVFASSSRSFTAQVQPQWTLDYDQVRAAIDPTHPTTTIIIDSRSPERYRGEVEPIDPYAGHIPGAIERFWYGVTDETGFAQPPEVQRQRWQAIAALDPDRVIVYCGSGVTACVNLLSIELARHHDPGLSIEPQLYAGSWSDWCAHAVDANDPTIACGA